MTVVLIAGMLVGGGLFLAWTGMRPAPEPLGAALARLDRRPIVSDLAPDVDRDRRFGAFLLRHLPMLARTVDQMRADLRIVGRLPEEQAARVGSYAFLSVLIVPWLAFVAFITGIELGGVVYLIVLCAAVTWAVISPFLRLRQQAMARRKAFSHALSAYCNVAVMSLAAGRGVEQALETASGAGEGWAFSEIRGALTSW